MSSTLMLQAQLRRDYVGVMYDDSLIGDSDVQQKIEANAHA